MILRMTGMLRRPRSTLLGPALAALLLAGCGGTAAGDSAAGNSASAATGAADDGGLSVVAAFYPLEYLVAGVGGDRVDVTGLTPPGAEPHDLELSPQTLASLTDADLLVVLSGFQPAVDDAVDGASVPLLDLAEVAGRVPDTSDGDHADDEHVDETHAADEHAHGDTDPHFWTDPTVA